MKWVEEPQVRAAAEISVAQTVHQTCAPYSSTLCFWVLSWSFSSPLYPLSGHKADK